MAVCREGDAAMTAEERNIVIENLKKQLKYTEYMKYGA